MKTKYFTTPLLLGGSLFVLSCGEKKTEEITETAENVPEVSEEVVNGTTGQVAEVAEVIPEISLEEVAKITGFAQNLPADIEGYLSLFKAGQSYDQLRETQIGKFINDAAAAQGEDLDEMEDGSEMEMARAILGEEFFLAFGKSAGAQGAKVSELYNRYYRMMGLMMIKGLESEITNDDMMMGVMSNPLGLLGEPKEVIAQFESMELPPVTIGMKVSDSDMREQIYGMISGGLASAMEFGVPGLEELAFEKDGVQLNGVTIAGKPLAALMEEQAELGGAGDFLGGEEVYQKLVKAVAAKNLHAATGMIGDYILIYAGGDLDGFKLSDGVNNSLISRADNEFLKLYAEKDVRVMSFIDGGAYEAISATGEILASMASGAQAGLEESEVFGDTRDIQALLGHVAKIEGELMGMGGYDSQGVVGFMEEGLKLESHGGSSMPHINLEKSHAYTNLANQDDIVFYLNSVSNPAFSTKLNEYLSTITETVYLAAKQFNTFDLDDPGNQEFKQTFEVFDQLAGKDLAELWTALSGDFSDGTGAESAIIIDLKGSLPRLPEVPEIAVEKGAAPRVALVMPVKDRTKIKNSWERVDKAMTKMIKNGHDAGMLPEEIVMQDVFKSQQAGLDTYNFQIPYTTQDALPTVALNNELFIASSSQVLNNEIVASLKTPQTVTRKGAYLEVNFEELHGFVESWIKLMEENQEAFFPRNYQKKDFAENLPMMKKALEALKDLDRFTMHTRKLGDTVRSSYHFKMN